jgi:hypothetical protein
MQTQYLVRGSAPVIDIKIRFLHAVERELGALAKPAAELPASGEPAFALVPSLEIDGKRFVAWQEAVEREILAPGFAVDEWLNGNVCIPFAFSRMRQVEPLRRSDGLITAAHRLRRRRRADDRGGAGRGRGLSLDRTDRKHHGMRARRNR